MEKDLKQILENRLNMSDVKEIVERASDNPELRKDLYLLTSHSDRRVSVNSIWCLTHLQKRIPEWFQPLQDDFIDRVLKETDISKKRMLLQILREQEYSKDTLRSDFLDFCFSRINSECEPYAVRAFALYTAFKMCRHYPELIKELREHLEMLSYQYLSPGLKSAKRQVETRLKRIQTLSHKK